ncbi:MAG TPA: hypothetical protein VGQ21_16790 [Thermoanaerobaculia bacterium]|jgi:4-amino-4-deoxy-L-arabinose transferase-like glycosyltransferase|nr:hypothetical protein [Thermoanaerobaculia bacterium]
MSNAVAERLAMLLLLSALAAQVVLAFALETASLQPDEKYQVVKAQYFSDHHLFPRATANDRAVESGKAWGISDWRPQGYALFLAVCSNGAYDPPALRRRVTLVQSLLVAVALILVFCALRRHTMRPTSRIAAALVLGIAPWPFEFARTISPDSIVAAFTAMALFLLGRYPRSVFFATLLFSITFAMRPEMIVLPPLIVGCAMLFQERQRVRFAIVAAIAFLAVLGAHYAYRIDFTGERWPPVFGGLHIRDSGAFAWTNSWIGSENEAYNFVYSLTNGQPAPPLPARAFANDAERRTVETMVAHVRAGQYSPADDDAFAALARRRQRENPARAVAARLWHTAHLWLNVEMNTQTLNLLNNVSRPVRHAILGALMVLKLALLAGFVTFIVRIGTFRNDAFLILCAVFVIARTLLVGIVLGWFTHRYVVNAWIPLMACAIAAVSRPDVPSLLGGRKDLAA